jgi:hypothetical protein
MAAIFVQTKTRIKAFWAGKAGSMGEGVNVEMAEVQILSRNPRVERTLEWSSRFWTTAMGSGQSPLWCGL